MPPATAGQPLRFGRFEISPAERVLRVDGQPAAVGARAFDLLLTLAQRRDRLVGRQELLDLVWPGVVVEEHNITAQISCLRKLLGPQVIATVPGRGYRFVATPDAPPIEAKPLGSSAASPSDNLPEQRTRFIGREAALADLARLLAQTRLLTLTGIGGCGKTRLALQLAQERRTDFPDGAWFIDLAPLRESERVSAACAAALGLAAEPELPAADRIAAHLRARQALLVLDNCEHVRAGAAALADAVLTCPGRTRIVATSREALAVAGEQVYPVRALSLPGTTDLDDVCSAEAVRVFGDRARLRSPEFEVDAGNAAAVVDICRRLDGHALAIELAAARVTMLSVSEIAARLPDRFRLLTGGVSAAARQQTLAATMQWSYDLLGPAESHMLRCLAAFAGGCTLEAAAAVAQSSDEYAALALLTALHDKSLLVVERGRGEGGGRPRYRMLETVRQYAQQRLDEGGDGDAVRTRHAGYFLALAETAAPFLRGPQQSSWMARLHEEHENLVLAMAWSAREQATDDPQHGLRLADATAWYWLFNEVELGCRLLLAALARDHGRVDSAVRCRTLLKLSAMYMHRGRGEEGLPHAREALAIARRQGQLECQAMALNGIGACLGNADTDEEAASLRCFEQARDLAEAAACAQPLASALNNIATIEFRQGKLASAEGGFRQALHLGRAQGDIRSTLIFLHNLIRVLVAARKHEDGRACAVEAELLLRGVGEDVLKLELLEVSAGLASIRGEHERAARFWGVATQRFTEAGYRRPTEDQTQLEGLSAGTRRVLGDAAFERAEAGGRALDLDAAMRELRLWLEDGRGSASI